MLRAGLVRLLAQHANVQLPKLATQSLASLCPALPAATLIQHERFAHSLWPTAASAWQPLQQQQQQQLHTSACRASGYGQYMVQLDRLGPSPGSTKVAHRWGRGNGGDRGTYCGRGVKGQKARKGNKPHLLFDGGQKQMKKFPKVWLRPSSPVLYHQVPLSRVLRWVRRGLLDASEVITMKDLRDSGCAPKTIRWGIELVAKADERPQVPLQLQVSSVSPAALKAVQAGGGDVDRVYYTRLGLKALLKPENYAKKGLTLPRPVRAWPPRENGKFDSVGQLPPMKQLQQAAV